MESNRKRRGGLLKAKLVGLPFYKSTKNASTGQHNNTKLVPSQQSSKSTTSVGFMVHQEYAPNPKVSFIVAGENSATFSQLDRVFSYPSDEAVDLKASNYISSVKERFKLEQINSEYTWYIYIYMD